MAGGHVRQMVLFGRWSYKAGGLVRQVVSHRGGVISQVVSHRVVL